MIRLLTASFLALLFSSGSADDDFDPGNFLAESCSQCHGDVVYSRPDHRMQNLQQLEAQVRRCDAQIGTALFDEDIEAVVQYLNDTYYRFQ